jgi:hypothetical protein
LDFFFQAVLLFGLHFSLLGVQFVDFAGYPFGSTTRSTEAGVLQCSALAPSAPRPCWSKPARAVWAGLLSHWGSCGFASSFPSSSGESSVILSR